MEDIMSSLIARLVAAHRQLNREIRRELQRRIPGHFRVVRLKKQRLVVKDRLYRHVPETDNAEMARNPRARQAARKSTARRQSASRSRWQHRANHRRGILIRKRDDSKTKRSS